MNINHEAQKRFKKLDERIERIRKKMDDYINSPFVYDDPVHFIWKKKKTICFERCLATKKLIWPRTECFYGINRYDHTHKWLSSSAMVVEKLKNPKIRVL